ncbi:ATP-binding protein [Bacteroidota bacterium]
MKLLLLFFINISSIIAQPQIDSLLFAIQEKPDTTQVRILKDLCWEFRSIDPEAALKYGLAALDKVQNINDPRYKPEILNFLGVIYGNWGRLDTAYHHYEIALETARSNNDSAQIAYSLNNIGDYYYKNAVYSMALEKVFTAYEIFEEIRNNEGMAYCLNDIGEVYLAQKNFSKALEYFNRSGRIRSEIDDHRGYAKSLLNISVVYANTDRQNRAFEIINEALVLSEKIGYIKGKSWALAGLSDLYLDQGKYSEALEKRFEALEIDLKIGNKYGEIINYNQVGYIYLKMNNLERANIYLTKARDEAAGTGHLDQLMTAYDYFKTLALARNDYRSAYMYITQYQTLQDSIFSHSDLNMIADLQTEFITERKDRENELLKNKLEFEEATRNYLLLIFALILIGAVLFAAKYKAERKSNLLLNELNASKDKFLSIIAHDLKNPFGAVANIASYLKSDYDIIPEEERKELIGSISDASGEIQNLLIDLLTWARTQRDDIHINKIDLNFEEILDSIKTSYSLFAKSKNISVNIDCDPNLAMTGDKFMLETILGNLLNNAIKFSYPDSDVNIRAEKVNGNVIISVTDFGKGMDKSMVKNIFNLNSKTLSDGTSAEKGTGLGLIICKELVNLLKGTIEIKSEVGEGTTITVGIPLS